jgi:DNA-binding CsgD family transcriptional regulator
VPNAKDAEYGSAEGERHAETRAAEPMIGGTRLRERQAAFDVLARAMDAAQGGAGRAVFIVADAGNGKTALLDWARAHASDRFRIERATGNVMESSVPFAFAEQFVGLLRSDRALDTADSALGVRASVHDVARVQVREWAQSGPVLVLLDDLQWADPDSIDLIAFLVRRLEQLPVTIICTLRAWPPRALSIAESLVHDGVADLVTAPALSAAASAGLVMELVGDQVDAELLSAAHEITGGNPQLIAEAARSIREDGALPERSGTRPAGLQRMLLLSHLVAAPAPVLDCVRAAAILGSRMRLDDVQAVAGQTPEEFADAFDAAVASGVLRSVDGVAEFVHDLLATAVYDDIAPAHRRLLHGRAYEHFIDLGDIALAAEHARAAGMTDARAIETIRDAGVLALKNGAVEAGLAHLQAAVDASGAHPPDDLLSTQADALFAMGRAGDAVAIYERLLGRLAAGEAGEQSEAYTSLIVRGARARAHAGDLLGARVAYERLLASEEDLGAHLQAMLLEYAHVLWELEGPAGAAAALETPRALADDSELVRVAHAYFRLGAGDPSGLSIIERATQDERHRLATTRIGGVATMNSITMQASAWGMTERVDEALELIDMGTQWLMKTGALRATVPLRVTRVGMLLGRGELFAALAEADDLDEEVELDPLVRQHLAIFRAQILIALGRIVEASELCDALDRQQAQRPWWVALSLEIARGQLQLAEAVPEGAADTFLEVERTVERLGIGEPCTPRWAGGAIEAALASGRPHDAQRVVDWLRLHSEELPCTWPRMIALAGQAGVAAASGHEEKADDLYRQALAVQTASVLDRAQIQFRYGAWLRRRNQSAHARAMLADVVRVAQERGAALLAERARAELSAAGGRRRRAAQEGLSAQEARVARRALTGATTREIAAELQLSPRTVESHLAAVYRKLAVSGKRELRMRRNELAERLA